MLNVVVFDPAPNVMVPVPPLILVADNTDDPPAQTVLGVARTVEITGLGFTVIVILVVLEHPTKRTPSSALNVYVVVVVGLAVTLAVLFALRPVDGLQLKFT